MIFARTLVPGLIVVATAGAWTVGCREAAPVETVEAEPWSVTAWGERYEVFPEVDPLIAGESSPAHTHVTALADFSPLSEGAVEIVLRGPGGEETFGASTPVRPGIFNIELQPKSPGEYELLFRISAAPGSEEIPGGAVRVGSAETPGGVARAVLPTEPSDPGEPISFLKEQQWRTPFATAWVRSGAIASSVRGLARVRPPAGGDAMLTASVDGVVQSSPWPFPGQAVRRGEVLFQLIPRVASERSLPDIEAEVASVEADAAAARSRLARLEELIEVEAVSRREVEEARARVTSLDSRLEALRRDRDAAGALRDGRGTPYLHGVRAPFDGKIAAVSASPGAAVAAGRNAGAARAQRSEMARSGSLSRRRPSRRRGRSRGRGHRLGRHLAGVALTGRPPGLRGPRGGPRQGHGYDSDRGSGRGPHPGQHRRRSAPACAGA